MATVYLLVAALVGPGLGHTGDLRVQELELADTPTNFDDLVIEDELRSAELISFGSADSRKGCPMSNKCTTSGGTSQAKGTCLGFAWAYSRKCECCFPTAGECGEKGYFRMPDPSNQCFKLFTQQRRNWTEASTFCESLPEGAKLARVYNAIDLRAYLVQRYGGLFHNQPWVWLNARGINSTMVWQDDGVVIGTGSPLWDDPRVTSNDCLILFTDYHMWNNDPIQTYGVRPCSDFYNTLCELI